MARNRTGYLVGLTGYARAGKDTAAGALLDGEWTRMAFADGVRDLALAIDPWVMCEDDSYEGERLSTWITDHGWDGAKALPNIRGLLQTIGKAVRDTVGPRAWVEALENRWWAANRPDTVITDVRYPNEGAWIQRNGGIVIRIDRPGVGPVNGHESETLVDAVVADAVVVNDGPPVQLQDRVAGLVQRHYSTPVDGLPF